MGDDTTQNGPKTGYRPPHKATLQTPHPAPLDTTPSPLDHSPWAQGRLIGTGSHKVAINVGQDTVDAEAFLAPRAIDTAIKGLPPHQQKEVHDALLACLSSPENCEDGINNQADLTVTNRDLVKGTGKTMDGKTIEQTRHDANRNLKQAQSTVVAEKQREAKILSDRDAQHKSGVAPRKPKLPAPH